MFLTHRYYQVYPIPICLAELKNQSCRLYHPIFKKKKNQASKIEMQDIVTGKKKMQAKTSFQLLKNVYQFDVWRISFNSMISNLLSEQNESFTSRRNAAWFGPTTHCLIVACSNTFRGGWLKTKKWACIIFLNFWGLEKQKTNKTNTTNKKSKQQTNKRHMEGTMCSNGHWSKHSRMTKRLSVGATVMCFQLRTENVK